jgi:hypothetical protein
MIDVLSRVTGLFGGTDAAPSIAASDLDEDYKRELAYHAQYRCAGCSVPEFRVESLYFAPGDDGDAPVPFCEKCLSERDRADEADEAHRLPDPYLGRRGYLIDPNRVSNYRHKKRGEVEVAAIEETDDPYDDDDLYAGAYPRRMVETRGAHPRQHLWLGYTARGIRLTEVGVNFSHLFRHMFFTGATRRGKSTLTEFVLLQHAWAGFGFCCIDPHGDLVDDLKQKLPPKRRDDVIWIEPSPGEVDRIVGLNLLDVGVPKDHPDFDEGLMGTIDGIVSVLKRGDYWGQKMGGIVENLLQGMILSETQYTLVDLHSILLDQERRKEFAAKIVEEGHRFVARYTKDIAEMDSDDLDALIRRVNKWVQYRVSREIIAHKESSVSIGQAVREGKIILVRNKVESPDVQRMIATAITGKIDREISKRDNDDPTAPDREPFFLCIDELDNVLTEEMRIPDLLADAGKYKLGLILMTQYPTKLPGEVVSAVKMNCETFVSFAVPDPDEAGPIAKMYGCDPSLLQDLGSYQAAVRIEINDTVRGPVKINTFPPQPPTRTAAEAREWIEQHSLDRCGVPRLSDEEIWYDSLDEHASGIDENTTGEAPIGETAADDPFELTDERLASICQAFYDESIHQGRDDSAVRFKDSTERITAYHDAGEQIVYPSHRGALFDALPIAEGDDDTAPLRCWEDENGDMWFQVTSRGRSKIFETGTAASSGGPNHRKLLQDCYRPFTSIGGQVTLPEQTGESMPDGSLSVDGIEWDDLTDEEEEAVSAALPDAHPLLAWLTDGRETAIEAESTTGDSKGGQTARNVAEAVNAGHRCLLLCREHNAEQVWNTLTTPPYISEYSDLDDDGNGEERMYNLGDHKVDREKMLRPAGPRHTVWIRDTETGEYVLRDSDGTELHRFSNAKAVFEDAGAYPSSVVDEPNTKTEIPEGYTTVKRPFVPEYDFNDGIPDRDMWEIITVESGATEIADLSLYRDGEIIPLDTIIEWEREQAESRAETAENGHTQFGGSIEAIDSLPDLNEEER